MKVLFLGFSVTADQDGFVECFASTTLESLDISKIALGGIQPHHLAFLVRDLLKNKSFDLVVLDISTAGFRSFLKKSTYLLALINILKEVMLKGAKPIVFDIPRVDVDPDKDWVFATNEKICKLFNLQYIRATNYLDEPLNTYFRDGIHTNSFGASRLAHILVNNINSTMCRKFSPSFDSIPDVVKKIQLDVYIPDDTSFDKVEFYRTGYTKSFLQLKEGEILLVPVIDELYCNGAFYLMGPETGRFRLNFGENEKVITALDSHCYYQRLGVSFFEGVPIRNQIAVINDPTRPNVELIKGELQTDNCSNYLGGFLVSNVQSIDEVANKLVDVSGFNFDLN
ncbi:hypothetical protein Q4602_00945 [Paraglaciecola chathamensis]|uniref:hypothetical protein n=1 Tax=Paraglaciecola chathamensis TaxID=368405 RepID=UPI0026F49C88|nr:hypothetical protein [Paraglaciecola chathamensis]MDO6838026.1 hypothetical protein [Paraglaciecola chathamensis]